MDTENKTAGAQISATLDWLALKQGEDGQYEPTEKTELARLEAERIIEWWQRAQGQFNLDLKSASSAA